MRTHLFSLEQGRVHFEEGNGNTTQGLLWPTNWSRTKNIWVNVKCDKNILILAHARNVDRLYRLNVTIIRLMFPYVRVHKGLYEHKVIWII